MSIDPCVTVSLLFGATPQEQAAGSTIVWLHGEHDASTAPAVSAAICRAVDLDGSDVTVDLSDVTFMGAATIEVIVKAKLLLKAQSLTLMIRRPSRSACRIIELCGLNALIKDDQCTRHANAIALRSWVEVKPLARTDDSSNPRRASEQTNEGIPKPHLPIRAQLIRAHIDEDADGGKRASLAIGT